MNYASNFNVVHLLKLFCPLAACIVSAPVMSVLMLKQSYTTQQTCNKQVKYILKVRLLLQLNDHKAIQIQMYVYYVVIHM